MMYSKISIYLSGIIIVLKTGLSFFLYNEMKSQFGESIEGDLQPSLVGGGDFKYVLLLFFIAAFIPSIIGIVKKNEKRFLALILTVFSFAYSIFPFSFILYVYLNSNG